MPPRISRTAIVHTMLFWPAAAGSVRGGAERGHVRRRRLQRHRQKRPRQAPRDAIALERMDESDDYRPPILFPWADDAISDDAIETPTAAPNEEEFAVSTSNVVFDIATWEPTSSPTSSPQTAAPTLGPAIVRGTVFHDVNQNGLRDVDEDGVTGVVVKLFTCSTQFRAGVTRTGEDGRYDFEIPAGDLLGTGGNGYGGQGNSQGNSQGNPQQQQRGCYYIQYNINENVMPDAIFTTPRNGETGDIFVAAGEELMNVDAGIVGVTPMPTPVGDWATSYPTTNPPNGYFVEATPPTPAPWVAMEFAPVTSPPTAPSETGILPLPSEEVAGPGSEAEEPEETAPFPVLTLPVETPVASTQAPTTAPKGAAVNSPPSPTAPTGVVWSPFEPAATGPKPDDDGKKPDEKPDKKPGDKPGGKHDLPGKETLIKPLGGLPAKEEDEGPLVSKSEVEEANDDDGILSLNATVRIVLAGLQSTMDAEAQSTFETVCAEFLNDQLQYATPPINDVGCAVLDQTLVNGRRRRLRDGSSYRTHLAGSDGSRRGRLPALANNSGRRNSRDDRDFEAWRYLASSGLAVDVRVTGLAKPTPSVQRAEDVQFEQLLVGTFNVQGPYFAAALREAEEEGDATTDSSYFQSVGEVRGMDTNGAELGEEGGDGGETVFTKGVAAAVAVGGVIVLLLLLLVGSKARRRRGARKGRAASDEGKAAAASKKNAKLPSAVGAARKATQSTGGAKKSNNGDRKAAVATSKNSAKTAPADGTYAKTKRSVKELDAADSGAAVATSKKSSGSSSAGTTPATTPSTSPASASASPVEAAVLTWTKSADSSASVETTLKTSISPASTPSPTLSPRPPSAPPRLPSPRVRRVITAPAGKLGLMVANPRVPGRGPAVHTVRPGSPVEGLVDVGDAIVEVNGVDTREYTAAEMTRLMRETAGAERRIAVMGRR